jgi:high-affinity iron transporter
MSHLRIPIYLRRLAPLALALSALAVLAATPASASTGATAGSQVAVATLIQQLGSDYKNAFPPHDPLAAARARALAQAAETIAAQANVPRAQSATRTAARLEHVLAPTARQFQIWPLPDQVQALTARLAGALGAGAAPHLSVAAAYAQESKLVVAAQADVRAGVGHAAAARTALAEAYAIFAADTALRLDAVAPELVTVTEKDLWKGFGAAPGDRSAAALTRAAARVSDDLHDDAASLGQVTVSRATIVSDAAIILFREGLEAVLILAAITASFTGARRRLRRPVFVGAGLGLLATVITYVLAQAIVDALGDGGLRLQAITGLLAIAVLLVVTNWFFHRVYWSEWISRFNRRRKALERIDRMGFISGQTLGFVILGLTSVYREGFETVLFLQNLQVSAGTGATLLGVAIGLGATLAVGLVTFALGRKLPYKRMLIVTGVLIGLVLAVMVGTTVNNLQGLGWLPTNSAGFAVDPHISQWLGFYPTWEGIATQFLALLIVYGSYALARQIQFHRRRRAVAPTPALAND